MSEVDLTWFCGKDDCRVYLNAPFSLGAFTYATDGHIIVRVARVDGVADIEAENMKRQLPTMFPERPTTPVVAIPDVPAMIEGECSCCRGEGIHEIECHRETYDCKECDGTGRLMVEPGESRYPRIAVSNTWFAPKYLRLLKTLPNVELHPNEQLPAYFGFDGGDGLLMPMRGER
jgi:hypothetical protein